MSELFNHFNIQSLRLRDFRRFKDYSIQFNLNPREVFHAKERIPVGPLSVLVARNGMGKTSILDAARVLFGRYTAPFRFASLVHLQKTDIRIGVAEPHANPIQAEKAAVSGDILLNGSSRVVDRELSAKKGMRTTIGGVACINDFATQIIQSRKTNPETEWPLLAFYGTGRLWSEHRNRFSKTTSLVFSADFGYENCLGENHNFKAVDTWLFDALFEKFATRFERLQKPTETLAKLAAIESAVNVVLGGEGFEAGLLINPTTKDVSVKQLNRDRPIALSVSQLSDGVRAAFGLVADIAFRCAILNPQYGAKAPARTHGIVLVDEVDLHLHPAWQQKILNTLQLAFPKLQFIVTTHSPQVVSSVPRECVRIIDPEQEQASIPAEQTEGATAQRMLNDVFDTPSRLSPNESELTAALKQYRNLIVHGMWDSPEAKTVRVFLQSRMPTDPELADLDMTIHLKDYQRRHSGETNP